MIHIFPYQTLAGLALFILTLIIDLITDYRLWLKKKTVQHIRGALLRCVGLIPAFFLMGWRSLGLALVYWVLCDGLMGVLIARNFFFIGTTSKLDQLKTKYRWLILVEYFGAAGGLALFISDWLNQIHHAN